VKFDPYDALGVDSRTPLNKTKTSANQLSLQYHPDKWSGNTEVDVKKAHDRMVDINKAKEVLLGEERKMAYDLEGIVHDSEFQTWLEEQRGVKMRKDDGSSNRNRPPRSGRRYKS
jgi:DnaJ-class molecular chaperone